MESSTLQFRDEPAQTASERVLAAIEAQEGTSAAELDRPLYDVIDPDALDALFRSPGREGQVTFTYLGYDITVRNNLEVEVEPVDE